MGLPAVIILSFDPQLVVGDLVMRWQTIGVTLALLVGLSVAAIWAAGILRTQRDSGALRLDDMVYIILGRGTGRGGGRPHRPRARLFRVLRGRPDETHRRFRRVRCR